MKDGYAKVPKMLPILRMHPFGHNFSILRVILTDFTAMGR